MRAIRSRLSALIANDPRIVVGLEGLRVCERWKGVGPAAAFRLLASRKSIVTWSLMRKMHAEKDLGCHSSSLEFKLQLASLRQITT
jgi:hypothetical protein